MRNSVIPVLVNLEACYYRELATNPDIFHITKRKSLFANKKKGVEAVEGGLYDKKIGDLTNIDKEIQDFSCECQNLIGRFYEGQLCPICNTIVSKTYLPNIEKFGWIDLGDHSVINPEAYELISSIISESRLIKILKEDLEKKLDVEGNKLTHNTKSISKSNLYENIGLIEFKKYFKEIILFYAKKKDKLEDAEKLIKWKNRIFTSKIPVYSTALRPIVNSISKNQTDYDKINKYYSKIATNADILKKYKNTIAEDSLLLATLFDIQQSWVALERFIIKNKLSGKTGLIRSKILGGNMSWCSRMVVIPFLDVDKFGMDHIIIGYKSFLEMYTFEIINILINGYSGYTKFAKMMPFEVVNYIKKAKYFNYVDEDIYNACKYLIDNHKDGLWILSARYPIMEIGSCEVFKIVDVIKSAKTNTMKFSTLSLTVKNGDFDGAFMDCVCLYFFKNVYTY